MKRRRKISFSELVLENKRELLNDIKAIERIEVMLETRHMQKAE